MYVMGALHQISVTSFDKQRLAEAMGVKSGQSLLVNAGTSSVGIAAINNYMIVKLQYIV
jgi:hypothetical protein